jgi:hypothetical protein
MKRIFAGLFVSLFFSFSAFSQTDSSELKTVELFSAVNADGKFDSAAAAKSCFSFITEGISCGKTSDIFYGITPYRTEGNWFRASGEGTRNKIEKLGKKNWTDKFKVPVVEPYAKLRRGLQRDAFVNASAARKSMSISEGTRNTGGANTFDERKGVFRDSKDSSDLPELKPAANSNRYYPFEKAALGNMYVMRVVDETNDFYVLFRVDELEKGKRVKISWKKFDAPTDN